MNTSVDKLNELFSSAKTYWVCPVTGTRIDAADVKAIAAHKEKVINNAIAAQKAKALKEGITVHRQSIQRSDSLDKLQSELSAFVCFLTGSLVDIQVQIHRLSTTGAYKGALAVTVINYKDLSQSVREAIGQVCHVAKEGRNVVILVGIENSMFLKEAYYWQNTRLDKQVKALAYNLHLAQFEEVVAKKAELKEIVRELHALRLKHAEVLKAYNDLKEIKLKSFEDIYRK